MKDKWSNATMRKKPTQEETKRKIEPKVDLKQEKPLQTNAELKVPKSKEEIQAIVDRLY